MAEPNQQQQAEKPKFQLFKPSEWPAFLGNWFWRLPGIRRFRVGRVRVGERYPPIRYELNKTWLPKNTTWFDTKLKTIEDFWSVMGRLYGDGEDETGEHSLLGNPKGIVRFYQDLGVYSDIERVSTEINWFLVGTGFVEENLLPEIPPEEIWRIYQWDPNKVNELINNRDILGDKLLKRVGLSSGFIYHEGKKEFEEELYCFGYANAEALAKRINSHNENIEAVLKSLGIEAYARGMKDRAAEELQKLINKIAEIEKETFTELNTLKGKIGTWHGMWADLITDKRPEAKEIGIIRFLHTYRIIKQYAILEIEERIGIKGRVIYDVKEDEKGTEKSRESKTSSTLKRVVLMKLKQDKNIYEEEEEELKEKIKELKKDLEGEKFEEELKIAIKGLKDEESKEKIKKSLIEQYNLRLKMHEQRLDDINNISNKADIIRQTTSKVNPNDFRQRPEELGFGLDENGYPLEIDPKTGEVLIDRWWSEIAQNKWQLKTIASKPGGLEYLKKHLDGFEARISGPRGKPEIDILNSGSRPIRYIKDQRFHGYVDLLEVGHIIYSEWDSFRDDLRDGRFHPHSKSAGDYVIEGMGNFDEQLGAPYFKGWYLARSKGIGVRRRGIMPLGPTGIYMDVADKNVLINAEPKWFENVPNEEKAVTRKYKIRLPDGSFKESERNPTKYNPAFDRRAENLEYVYWGRMYWYEWISAINKWSENPFPHISTRGIALYISHLVATDVWNYKDAEDALEGHKFDYGVRGQGEYGYVNPLSGKGILQEN